MSAISVQRPQRRFAKLRAEFDANSSSGALGVREFYACIDTTVPRIFTISTADILASVDTEIWAFTVRDESGGANANNILVVGEGGQLIDGTGAALITEDFGFINLYASGGALYGW